MLIRKQLRCHLLLSKQLLHLEHIHIERAVPALLHIEFVDKRVLNVCVVNIFNVLDVLGAGTSFVVINEIRSESLREERWCVVNLLWFFFLFFFWLYNSLVLYLGILLLRICNLYLFFVLFLVVLKIISMVISRQGVINVHFN